jgi:LPS sulfotransferase NodH
MMQVEAAATQKAIRRTDEAFDFEGRVALRKSYIIASLPRSGSQFLSGELWKTGALGAPCEYLFPAYDMRPMMNRLRATSPADYIAKLVACRSSPNGVFGMNVHIQHFKPFLRGYPALLDVLQPLTFIHTTRRNKVAQAVSMAKAYQTSTWTSLQAKAVTSPTTYNRELIERCIEDLAHQEREWEQWFVEHDVRPFRLAYEDLAADRAGTIRTIMAALDVKDDERKAVEIPPVEKQSDGTNAEWIARFEAETKAGDGLPPAQAGAAAGERDAAPADAGIARAGTPDPQFRGLYDHHINRLTGANRPSAAYVDVIRSRHLFNAIVGSNSGLFENARVLELPSADGRWGLAALDAGAAHVTCVEPLPRLAARAARTLAEAAPGSYEIVNADVFSALAHFQPNSFDLIMCVRFFERHDPQQMFREWQRQEPRFVILDTNIAPGRGPVLRFTLQMPEIAGNTVARRDSAHGNVVGIPTADLIAFLCDFFGFRCHRIDWNALGITDWTGVHDYEQGRRQTFLLERAS